MTRRQESAWDFPLVTIVTPTYNQGKFIEDTIISIKEQDYPYIEHIIIDGGSTDNTLEIIKKYEGTYNMRWISEHDDGQTQAINKGFRMLSGDILAWLNSDDTYLKTTVSKAVDCFRHHSDIDIVYGNCYFIDASGRTIGTWKTIPYNLYLHLYGVIIIPQPSAFWRRKAFFDVGMLDEDVKIAMDGDLWFRFALAGCKFYFVDEYFSNFRLHPDTRSNRLKQEHLLEARKVRERILGRNFTGYEMAIRRPYAKFKKWWIRICLSNNGVNMTSAKKILPDDVKAFFDFDASRFAGHRWFGSEVARFDYDETRSLLLRYLQLKPSDSVLEIGCGPGVWTDLIAPRVERLNAIDISDEMLKQAQLNVSYDNVLFERSDFLVYETLLSFDKLFSVRAIEYFQDKRISVEKMFQLLKPSGRVVIITKTTPTFFTLRSTIWHFILDVFRKNNDLTNNSPRFVMEMINPWALRRLFRSAGFRQIETYPVILRFPFFIRGYPIPLFKKQYQDAYERALLNFCNRIALITQKIPGFLYPIVFFFLALFSESYLLIAEK